MSAHTDQVLTEMEQRAVKAGVALDGIDAFIAERLGVPVASLYAYLRVCFAAERFTLDERERELAVQGGERP